jgi:hypothetical protein
VLSIVIRLIIVTVLVYAGVHLWYGVVEKRLQERPPAKVARQSQQVATKREQLARSNRRSMTFRLLLSEIFSRQTGWGRDGCDRNSRF